MKNRGMSWINGPRESEECVAFMEFVELMENNTPDLKWLFHVPNEGKRSWFTGKKLKREGMKRGIPDYVWLVPRGPFHGLLIEMKTKDGVMSADQIKFKIWAESQGYCYVLARSASEAIAGLMSYIRIPGAQHQETPPISVPKAAVAVSIKSVTLEKIVGPGDGKGGATQ